MRHIVACSLLLGTALAHAEPAAIATSPVAAAQLPKGVAVRGETFVRALKFEDKNGTNYLVFSTKASAKPTVNGMQSRSAYVFVDDWVVPAKGAPRSLLPVRDMVVDCEMGDPTAQFHPDAVTVTDLDHDGIAEITIGYETACRSDVSPATYKLLLLENGTKYILRGKTRIKDGSETTGGTFAAEPTDAKWPPAFLTHAHELWDKTAGDLQLPGG